MTMKCECCLTDCQTLTNLFASYTLTSTTTSVTYTEADQSRIAQTCSTHTHLKNIRNSGSGGGT